VAGGRRKQLSNPEKEFAKLVAVAGLGPAEAARKAFGWRCAEAQKARDMARKPRVKELINILRSQNKKEAEVSEVLIDSDAMDLETLRKFAVKRLKELRDDVRVPAQSRFKAIEALEKLADPSKDINLIWRWITMVTRGASTHCPCCHNDIPLASVKMPRFRTYLAQAKQQEPAIVDDIFERRKQILSVADKKNTPHPDQEIALRAPERHIMGMGAARGGKSYLIALFAILYFLVPGTESWILAKTFDEARSEREYLEKFLHSLFYPYDKYMVSSRYDSKSGEWTMTSRWGSEVKIKSSKSQGTITGRELDAIFAAEPGWLPDDIFNHVLARLSSRLGRIIALGTPQGLGGFISRLVFATGRDPVTGRVRRLTKEDRLISNGAPWGISALVYNLDPRNNPGYVKSELDSARQMLSDDEYASEFEGEMVAHDGMKFNAVKQMHLHDPHPDELARCSWVLGVDQGQKNFGAVLAGWNGDKIIIARDFFEGDFKTIRSNLLDLRREVPRWITSITGDPRDWKLSIFDQDPPLIQTFMEMEDEMTPWPTDITYRHDNKKKSGMTDDWRKETTVFINEMAKQGKLQFMMDAAQIHDEVMRTENLPGNPEMEGGGSSRAKGWKISGSWRQDHVLDAFMFVMWTVLSNQVEKGTGDVVIHNPWEEQRRGFDYQRQMQEERDLAGWEGTRPTNGDEKFRKIFGRDRGRRSIPQGPVGHYPDY
jgi:hypothetical protein